MNSDTILKVENLTKIYSLTAKEKKKKSVKFNDPRGIVAVNGLSFELRKGEILGLIGSNGAGKTTTLRLLSTAIDPTQGVVTIHNRPDSDYIRKNIGFLSNTTGLHPRLTPRELITFYGQLHEVPNNLIVRRLEEMSKSLNFERYLDIFCEKLSFGNKQKVSIARAMIHKPEIVIMDEPTTGLDVFACAEVMESIQELKKSHKAVIFSSHNMEDIQQVCDRILVLDAGKDVFQGRVDVLLEKTKTTSLREAIHSLLEEVNIATKN